MTPDDRATEELVRSAADEISPEVSRFIGTIAGSPAIEVSELIAEQIRAWRFRLEIRHLRKAMAQLEQAGLSPKVVPMRTLAPLIEGASLEDDESLGDRWASLLANAASGSQSVPPSFPGVLRELDPVGAQLLDYVYETHMQLAPDLRPHFAADVTRAQGEMALSDVELEFHVDNLIRLRLITSPGLFGGGSNMKHVSLTQFGRSFVRACRPLGHPDPEIVWTDRAALQEHINQQTRREAEAADGTASEATDKARE
jgi:hypothetical protein